MKKVVILGATGSIGVQALECLTDLDLVGFSFYKNVDFAQRILNRFPSAAVFSPKEKKLNTVKSFEDLILQTKPDLVLNAIVGWDGLKLSLFCVKNEINLALANKESLVIAGDYLIDLIKSKPNYKLYPVDSEHSSLYELIKVDKDNIKTIYITASGGPFYHLSEAEKKHKIFEETIKHPKWNMGYKISIDSATLVNKCFELIEAYYLFHKRIEIKALYHPQAVVHAMVEFKNNSLLANLSFPNMKLAIDLALHEFQKQTPKIEPLKFHDLNLNFNEIDPKKWKPIQWAYDLMQSNNKAYGVIINTVNDYAIEMYKNGLINFNEITSLIEKYLLKFKGYVINELNDLFKLHEIILWTLKEEFNAT